MLLCLALPRGTVKNCLSAWQRFTAWRTEHGGSEVHAAVCDFVFECWHDGLAPSSARTLLRNLCNICWRFEPGWRGTKHPLIYDADRALVRHGAYRRATDAPVLLEETSSHLLEHEIEVAVGSHLALAAAGLRLSDVVLLKSFHVIDALQRICRLTIMGSKGGAD